MLPFGIVLRGDGPIHEQVVYAVRRAVVTGQLRPGDAFPSVRALSVALKINPNTAHKIVAALTDEGLLLVRPGIGTVVGEARPGNAAARRAILEQDTERLVVAASAAGLTLAELLTALRRRWAQTVDGRHQ
jgi:GntR family transcriptional regulator